MWILFSQWLPICVWHFIFLKKKTSVCKVTNWRRKSMQRQQCCFYSENILWDWWTKQRILYSTFLPFLVLFLTIFFISTKLATHPFLSPTVPCTLFFPKLLSLFSLHLSHYFFRFHSLKLCKVFRLSQTSPGRNVL